MSIFQVVDKARMRDWHPTDPRSSQARLDSLVILETDDWVEAEARALTCRWESGEELRVWGVHPSHTWDTQIPRRCTACPAWDNGCYSSHAPCGYVFGGSLVTTIAYEMRQRMPLHVQVAELVMGWRECRWRLDGEWIGIPPQGGADLEVVVPYDRDLVAAWSVVERMRSIRGVFKLFYGGSITPFTVTFFAWRSDERWQVDDDKLERAICRAAVSAMGAEPRVPWSKSIPA